jgi:hypothetical protein
MGPCSPSSLLAANLLEGVNCPKRFSFSVRDGAVLGRTKFHATAPRLFR